MSLENPKIKINPLELPNIKCEKCENIFFEKVTIIKKISKLLTGSPADELIPMETYVCRDCGHINKDFNIIGNDE
jgi:hypothetical protein